MKASTNPKNPAIEEAIAIFGSIEYLAKWIGCHRNTVSNWLYRRSQISLRNAHKISVKTRGKISIKSMIEGNVGGHKATK